ncbi:MAG: hypothetical protein WBB50_04550 [Methyloceanibacter sp.]
MPLGVERPDEPPDWCPNPLPPIGLEGRETPGMPPGAGVIGRAGIEGAGRDT